MNKYLAEFIGMFFFVLTVGCVVIGNSIGALAPLAIGSVLMVMIYAGGHISGGHFNPAVTLGVWLRGKCDTKDVLPYMIAQIAGAVLAAFVVKFLRTGTAVTPMSPGHSARFTGGVFVHVCARLCCVECGDGKGTSGNSFYGLAIGFTVVVGAFAVGNISGGVFNPAIAVGISILGLSAWSNIWIYLVADFAGAAAAAAAFKIVSPEDK